MREGERETSMWERNINQFPLIQFLTGDGTHNILLLGMMLQLTEQQARTNVPLEQEKPKLRAGSTLQTRPSYLEKIV